MKLEFPDGRSEEIIPGGRTIETVALDMGIEPLEVIFSRNGEIIPEDYIPSEHDSIRVIRISHGG